MNHALYLYSCIAGHGTVSDEDLLGAVRAQGEAGPAAGPVAEQAVQLVPVRRSLGLARRPRL